MPMRAWSRARPAKRGRLKSEKPGLLPARRGSAPLSQKSRWMSFGRRRGKRIRQGIEHRRWTVTDRFQLTTIIASAIRECRNEAAGQQGHSPRDSGNTEEDHRMAKAVLTAVAEAGFEICPKKPG